MTKRILKYQKIPLEPIYLPMGPRGIDQVEEVELFLASNPATISVDVVMIHGFTDSWKSTWRIQGNVTIKYKLTVGRSNGRCSLMATIVVE
jgi:hypothetical protein